jgi:flavin-dependent dehydrogenase
LGALSSAKDAIVIGGGPAGCAAAIGLARRGVSVTLLERDRIVAPKVCGEFLSVEACAYARALGVDVVALGAAPIERVRVSLGNTTVESRLPFRAASLSRIALDTALLDAARNAGVALERETRALHLQDGRVRIRRNDSIEDRTADAFVLATGKTELPGYARLQCRTTPMLGFKMHLELAPAQTEALGDAVELTLFAGGYAGMQRIENGNVAFALAINRDAYTRLGSWGALVAAFAASNSRNASRLAGARELWLKPLAVSGVPYGFVHRPTKGVEAKAETLYRTGDQLAVIPSFTGDGIAIALVTGAHAARAIADGQSAAAYHEAMAKKLKTPMFVAAALSNAIASPFGRAAVVWPARILPAIFSLVASQTRIEPPGAKFA